MNLSDNQDDRSDQSVSPTPIKVQQQPEMLTFVQALAEIMAGRKVTKVEWGSGEVYGSLKSGILTLHKEDNQDYNWILSDGDIEGNDWNVL